MIIAVLPIGSSAKPNPFGDFLPESIRCRRRELVVVNPIVFGSVLIGCFGAGCRFVPAISIPKETGCVVPIGYDGLFRSNPANCRTGSNGTKPLPKNLLREEIPLMNLLIASVPCCRGSRWIAGVLLSLGLAIGAGTLFGDDADGSLTDENWTPPKGLPVFEFPEDNRPSADKIALGKQLYFDKRLSQDMTISCASCHDPAKGWSDGEVTSTGVGNQKGGRNSPTIINSVYNQFHFWDGRAGSLEEQALGPIQNPIEMNMKLDLALERINKIPGYREQFEKIFDGPATEKNLAQAIAAYERTIVSGDAPYDRYAAGDKDALSESAQRGLDLFFGKAVCSACHSGPNFTDNAFHNIGVGMDKDKYDKGRVVVTGLGGDTGAFKTPTLREIARTAPYMHDGSMKTLEEVVEHYDQGGIDNPWLSEDIFPLELTEQEKKDLVTFMKEGLSSESYPNHKPPRLPE